MARLFDHFKDILTQAVADTDFVRKNTLLQDAEYLADIQTRIAALDPTTTLQFGYTNIISLLGMMVKDTTNRNITFDPKGFMTTLSAFREGLINNPRRLWLRAGATDGIDYLLADGGTDAVNGRGVFALNSDLNVVYRFPHYGSDLAGSDEYEDAGDVVTFTISTVEYIAIASTEHHVVQIYKMGDDFAHVVTIGTIDTPGAAGLSLTEPWALAVDETNELLYIGCKSGQPAGATASNGFVSVVDISTVAVPVSVGIPLFYNNTGSLLDGEVTGPKDLFYDGTLVWVSNGDDTVGGMDFSNYPGITFVPCTKYLETSGAGYTFRTTEQVTVSSELGGYKRIFVANLLTGSIEEFNYNNLQHLQTYGIRANEDNAAALYDRLSPDIYGAISSPSGVLFNTPYLENQLTDIFLVTDTVNKRLHQFNYDSYTVDNYVNFGVTTSTVPLLLTGWTVNGTIPVDMVTVYYRFAETDEFQILPQETSIGPTTTVQIRVGVTMDTRRFLKNWYLDKVVINAEQA